MPISSSPLTVVIINIDFDTLVEIGDNKVVRLVPRRCMFVVYRLSSERGAPLQHRPLHMYPVLRV